MKQTPFFQYHKNKNAKMLEFAGYNMPLEYSGVTEEHINVRENVGLFDVSHMGEFWVKGPKAFDLVQKLTSNDVAKLSPGKIQYTCMPNGKGGIVDDLLVYHYEDEKYMLVVNAANIEKDWNWINKNNTFGAELENASDDIALLAVQGPKATQMLQELTEENLSEIKFYTFKTGKLGGVEELIISATGYTGAGGFELYVYNKDAQTLINAIESVAEKYDMKPAGLAARDTLRLEKGFCLYGNDINDETSPLEAGLSWITKLTEGNDFIDRDYTERLKAEGLQRRLRGFIMQERGIPRKDYDICDAEGNKIGTVTSGTMSPMMKKGIGMGYIDKGHWAFGNTIYIKVRKKLLKAEIVKQPIYKD